MNESHPHSERKTRPVNAGIAHILVRDSADGVEVIHAFGDLDLSCSAELESMIVALSSEMRAPAVVVNLSACHYLDSTILTVFVRASRELSERFAVVVPPDNPVRRIFAIVGLDTVLGIDDSLEACAERMEFALPQAQR